MKIWQAILLCVLWSLLSPIIFVYGLGLTGGTLIACSFLWGIPAGLFCGRQIIKSGY